MLDKNNVWNDRFRPFWNLENSETQAFYAVVIIHFNSLYWESL